MRFFRRLEERESFHVKYCKNDGNKFSVKSQDPEISRDYLISFTDWSLAAWCLGEVSWDYHRPGSLDNPDKSGEKNNKIEFVSLYSTFYENYRTATA